MTWTSKAATLVMGVMLLTPLHIFLTGESNSSLSNDRDLLEASTKLAKDLESGKTAWELLKELQTDLEKHDKAKKSTGDPSGVNIINPLKLVFTLWAKETQEKKDEKSEATLDTDPKHFDEKNSDPLENGVMLAISGALLFVMITVLVFDIGGKTRWPLSFGLRSSTSLSRELLADASTSFIQEERAEVEHPSHRIRDYLENRRTRSRSKNQRRNLTVGFEKTSNKSSLRDAHCTHEEYRRCYDQHLDENTENYSESTRKSQRSRNADEPATGGVYGTVKTRRPPELREGSPKAAKEAQKQRVKYTYSSSHSELHCKGADPKATQMIGDASLSKNSRSFAIETTPSTIFPKPSEEKKATHHHQKNKDSPVRKSRPPVKPPAFLNCVLQCISQCPLLKYFFVDGPSQVYFGEKEHLASPLTQNFAAFIRNVWQDHQKQMNVDNIRNVWTQDVFTMFNAPNPSLEHYLNTFFLTLYTDLKSVAKVRRHYNTLPEEVRKIGKWLLSGFLERRKIEVLLTDEQGREVPRELLAHSAIAFPGVAFSSSNGAGLFNLLNQVCHSGSGTQLTIENETMQVPFLLNFHQPDHYFSTFPEKVYIHHRAKDTGEDIGPLENAQDVFSLYAVCFQLVPSDTYAVALKHATYRHWYYTDGPEAIRIRSPSAEPPTVRDGVKPKPILLLYVAEKWNENLPFFNAESSGIGDGLRQEVTA